MSRPLPESRQSESALSLVENALVCVFGSPPEGPEGDQERAENRLAATRVVEALRREGMLDA